jgi:hypothetical protein
MVTVNNPTTPQPAVPATPAPQDSVMADLDVLISQGVVERTVKPFGDDKFKNMCFTMHTLKNTERCLVAKEIPNEDLMAMTVAEQAPKVPTLVYAITCIASGDKQQVFDTPAQKEVLRSVLNRMSAVMVDMLYLEYVNMTNDLIKIIETGVKKN